MTQNHRPKMKPHFALAALLAAATGLALTVAFVYRWPLAMPVAAIEGALIWLATGLYSCIPVASAGHFAAGRLLGFYKELPGAQRLAISWALGWLAAVGLGIVLLAAGLFSKILLQLVILAGNLSLLLWVIVRKWRPLIDSWHRAKQWRALLEGNRLPLFSWRALMVAIFIMSMAHAMVPPDTRDELAYHLVVPRLWQEQGSWILPFDNPHLLFPGNQEIVWGYAIATGDLKTPRFVTLAFALLTVVLLWQWMLTQRVNRWVQDFSLVFLIATPVLLNMTSINYVEWPMFFYIFLGWQMAGRHLRDADTGSCVAASLFYAASLGMKYSAIPVVGLLGLGWLRRLWPVHRTRFLHAGASLAAACALFAAPWWIRNYNLTGDPFFPIGAGAAGYTQAVEPDASAMLGYAGLEGLWRVHPWVYHATVEPIEDHRMHLLWPVLHLAVVFLGWRRRSDLPWWTVVGTTALFALHSPSPRIYMPLMGLCWLFLPGFLEPFGTRIALRRACTLFLALMVCLSIPFTFHYWFMSRGKAVQDYLIGLVKEEAFLLRSGLSTPVLGRIRSQAPPALRVWAWCEDQVLYVDRWVQPDSPYAKPAFVSLLERGGPDLLTAKVRRDHIDLILVNRNHCPDAMTRIELEGSAWDLDPDLTAQIHRWMASNLEEYVRDGRYVVYRVIPPEWIGKTGFPPKERLGPDHEN